MPVQPGLGKFEASRLWRPRRGGLSDSDYLEVRFVAASSLLLFVLGTFVTLVFPLLLGFDPVASSINTTATLGMGASYLLAMRRHQTASGWLLTMTIFVAVWLIILRALDSPEINLLTFATVVPIILAFSLRRVPLGIAMTAFTLAFVVLHEHAAPHPPGESLTLAVLIIAIAAIAGLAPALRVAERGRAEKAEDEIQTQAARVRSLLDNLEDAAFIVDLDRRILAANAVTFRHYKGRGLHFRLGADLVDCLDAEGKNLAKDILPRTFAGESVRLERHLEVHGQDRVVIIHTKPIGEGDKVSGATITITDVTEEREHQQLREEHIVHEAELAKANEVSEFKTQLLNIASHELNTPLTPIKLQLNVLRKRLADAIPPEAERALAAIERSTDRMAVLIQDLLDVARLEAGQMKFQRSPMDLARLIHEELELIAPDAEEKGVALAVEGDQQLALDGDPVRLSQVLTNLFSNAVKFSPGGGQVTIRSHIEDGQVRVEVQDEGMGIDPAAISGLFQPFQRVREEDQPTIPGTGLGLFICKGIVEAHGGAIGLQSDGKGRGTTAWFTLPVGQPARGEEVEPAPPAAADGT